MQDYRKLEVWRKGHRLALEVYHRTAAFPRAELFGLTSQMRRSAVSVPANIAEGCGRSGRAELAHFLHLALASGNELEYYVHLASDLTYLRDSHPLLEGIAEVRRMLVGLLSRVKAANR